MPPGTASRPRPRGAGCWPRSRTTTARGSRRPWTEAEADLAAAVAERLGSRIPEVGDVSFFDGLSSIIGALIALDAPGADEAVHRLLATAETDGWPPAYPLSPEKHRPGSRINDATLGT